MGGSRQDFRGAGQASTPTQPAMQPAAPAASSGTRLFLNPPAQSGGMNRLFSQLMGNTAPPAAPTNNRGLASLQPGAPAPGGQFGLRPSQSNPGLPPQLVFGGGVLDRMPTGPRSSPTSKYIY